MKTKGKAMIGIAMTAIMVISVFVAFTATASEVDKAIDYDFMSLKVQEKAEDLPILLKSREFVPTPGIEINFESRMSAMAEGGVEKNHILIQFDHIPTASERETLEAIGVDLQTYIPRNAWFADVDTDSIAEIGALENVRWLGDILAEDKIAPHIKDTGVGSWAVNPDGSVNLLVTLFDDVSADEARQVIGRYGSVTEAPVMSNYWRVTFSESDISNLAGEDAVQWIQEVAPPLTVHNDGSRAAIGGNAAQAPPYNLDGSGVVIGEWDSGWADWTTHNDLVGRVIVGDAGHAVAQHSTHVAGTAMGDGANSGGVLRGMANSSTLVTYEWPNTINEMDTETLDAIVNHSAVISTNSWGWRIEPGYGPCSLYGDYDVRTQNYDDIVDDKLGNPITIVFSAGNEETNNVYCPGAYPHPWPWGRVTGPGGTAKNTIVVGATYSDTNGHTSFSSRGPTDDGRIKPDVSAPGDEVGGDGGINSTLPGQSYGVMAGTSMSAPAVAGSAAMLFQDYRNTHGAADPTPATVKALLIHTAQDLGNAGPDYTYGWGLINVPDAADVIRADTNPDQTIFEEQVNHSEVKTIYVNVTPGTAELRATLVWTDEPGAVAAATKLVNDLDLEIYDVNTGTTILPWVLDPSNPGNAATTGYDSINNVEQVVLNAPASGLYAVRVTGWSVPTGPQPYSLIVTGGSPTTPSAAITSSCATTIPTIDGVISAGEWDDAMAVNVTNAGVPLTVTMYVKNDDNTLYVAFDDPNDATLPPAGGAEVGIYFDDEPPGAHDGAWTYIACPSDEGNFWVSNNPIGAPNTFRGWIAGPGTCPWITPAPGVTSSISTGSGHVQYEAAIDLTTSALKGSPGDTIGFRIFVLDADAGAWNGYWPLFAIYDDPSTYGELTLATCPAARVPALTPIGLIALVGLLSVIAAMSIKIRKRRG